MGRAVTLVTDMSFPASSEQGRKANHIGYTVSFSNAGLQAMGMISFTKLAERPASFVLVDYTQFSTSDVPNLCLKFPTITKGKTL